jgi:hypothetical protein
MRHRLSFDLLRAARATQRPAAFADSWLAAEPRCARVARFAGRVSSAATCSSARESRTTATSAIERRLGRLLSLYASSGHAGAAAASMDEQASRRPPVRGCLWARAAIPARPRVGRLLRRNCARSLEPGAAAKPVAGSDVRWPWSRQRRLAVMSPVARWERGVTAEAVVLSYGL